MLWPTWLDEAGIQAKSPEMGGETLAQHTWAVLSRLSDQVRLRPLLPAALGGRIWHRLYWGCFLHDFGKSAIEFQERLRRVDNQWKQQHHRHEVLSLAFVDWLFPKGHLDREWVIGVIAFHHKDAPAIFDKYGGTAPLRDMDSTHRELVAQSLGYLGDQIGAETSAMLWRWIDTCALDWAGALNIPVLEPPALLPQEQAEKRDLANGIFQALRSYNRWLSKTSATEKQNLMLHRGLILTADHAASAGVEPFPDMPLTMERAHHPLGVHALRDHQAAMKVAPPGSAILVAPTGSGKTEGALLWAARQIEHRPAARIFYTLPYQASMNAMRDRLATRVFGHKPEDVQSGKCREVAVQHSRALLKHYQDYMALDESDSRTAQRVARDLRNLARLNVFPIQVFSPYQMLKAAYSLKGYETLLLDYTDALFIFDEIHAYETRRAALILTFMAWLRRQLGARFLVMTATLPPPLLERLQIALDLPSTAIIHASPQEFTRSQRHTVHLLDGCLEDGILAKVQRDWAAGRSVLICLNRVGDAQRVYRLLRDRLKLCTDVGADDYLAPDEEVEIVLLHSRFNGDDRARKERILLARAGVGRARHGAVRPFICVATQVVEVSLDVDFDTLYTAPAPLDAMLQRFGRVNRGRAAAVLCPVHVYTAPSRRGEKVVYLPYEQDMVEASLGVLRHFCNDSPIDESLVNTMLGEIYTGAIRERWEQDYDKMAVEFERAVLATMKPCQSAGPELFKTFYEMFDGREVLPVDLYPSYLEAMDTEGYLGASRYLVNISNRQYKEFCKNGLIKSARDLEGEFADHILVDYSREYGLDLDGAREQIRAQKAGVEFEDDNE
jgi:CRISPR-associated endonuclease/helicase Cas3